MSNVCKSLQSVRFSTEPKGIGSILSEDLEAKQRRESSSSLRRSLSADMSSQGWIQNTPLRKTCSSYELSCNSDSDEDRNDAEDDGCIFSMSDGEEEEESTGEDRALWSLICLQNQKTSFSSLIPQGEHKKVESLSRWEPCKPYVHPKKQSKLNDQSLKMCTEALGCESGSDCSDHSLRDLDDICSSSSEDSISLQDEEERNENFEFQSQISKFPGNVQEKEVHKSIRTGRSFPPPLSSVSGAAVHMRSFKQDGRLLLQAVKVDSHKYLRAHRHGGRLQLHFISSPPNCSQADEKEEEEREQEEEFKAQKSAQEEHKVIPTPSPQLKISMLTNPSNLRRHVMKSEYLNLPISKESFFNFNLKEQQQSLLREVRCSSRSSNDLHLKFGPKSQPPSCKLSSSNEFCKVAVAAPLNAVKNSLQSRPPSQSLITSPYLLNYPLNASRCSGTDLQKSAFSLPKLPLKDGFRRCKERKWLLNWDEHRRIAIS